MTTALDHPLVRDYLSRLDVALVGLPVIHAAELREQLLTHLSDALAPEADEIAVARVLNQLGDPNDVAAEAGAPPAIMTAPHRGKARLPLGFALVAVTLAIFALVLTSTRRGTAPAVHPPATASVKAPAVVGQTFDVAKVEISRLGLKVTVTSVYSAKYPRGWVITQSPATGEIISPGSTLQLQISAGPTPG